MAFRVPAPRPRKAAGQGRSEAAAMASTGKMPEPLLPARQLVIVPLPLICLQSEAVVA